MISPAPRMIAIAAAVAVPACAAASLWPFMLFPGALLLFILLTAAAVDAFRGRRALAAVGVTTDPALRWLKGRQSTIAVHFAGQLPSIAEIRVNLELPPGITALEPVATRVASVDARESAVHLACLPEKRGLFHVDICNLGAASPWRLWQIQSQKAMKVAIRVFPDLENERGAKMLFLRKSGGLRTQRLIGRGREFERLRDYTHGDTFDEIYWKATARRGKPVVKVFQMERTQDVYVIIDSSRLGAKNSAADRFVSAALMMGLAAENQGDNFGLVTFSDGVDHFVPAGRGRRHFSRCRECIYDLQTSRVSPDLEELLTFLQLHIRKRSLLLFLTDLTDPLLAETFSRESRMLARRHVVVVSRLEDDDVRPLFSGEPPRTTEEIHSRLAGHLQWVALKDLEKTLNRFGIGVHALRPETVGMDLVEQYVEIKRRQIL